MARRTGKEMKEAFVWTIPNLSMTKKVSLVSHGFRYHGFMVRYVFGLFPIIKFPHLLHTFETEQLCAHTRWCSVWTSRLLCFKHCQVLANKILRRGSCFVRTKLLTLIHSDRLTFPHFMRIELMHKSFFLFLKQETFHRSTTHKNRRHLLHQHFP